MTTRLSKGCFLSSSNSIPNHLIGWKFIPPHSVHFDRLWDVENKILNYRIRKRQICYTDSFNMIIRDDVIIKNVCLPFQLKLWMIIGLFPSDDRTVKIVLMKISHCKFKEVICNFQLLMMSQHTLGLYPSRIGCLGNQNWPNRGSPSDSSVVLCGRTSYRL